MRRGASAFPPPAIRNLYDLKKSFRASWLWPRCLWCNVLRTDSKQMSEANAAYERRNRSGPG
jgi:hypothetical protein